MANEKSVAKPHDARYALGRAMKLPLLLALLAVTASAAASTNDLLGPAFHLIAENDMVVRTDRHYTHGTKFTLLGSEVALPRQASFHLPAWLAEHTPDFGAQPHAARLGASLVQSIYTPTDIATTALQLNDRPYAGVLYASLLLQKRGGTHGGIETLDTWRMDLGVIGPESHAEDAQNTVHRVRNLGLANGWPNQLKTEPALALRFQRTWRWAQGAADGWAWDVLPAAGVSVGNIGTYGVLGGQLRAGWRLPGDFGVQTIDSIAVPNIGRTEASSASRGIFAFVGVEGRAVAYSAFLDGNLWRASHHVSKFPLVGDGKFGLVYSGKRFDLSLAQIIRSKEFVGQREIDAYGSLALSMKWDRPRPR